ncbi:MAG TPA: ECF-type sigma factor [Gemmatimonadaceae bacterium]|nr:ECF-type sigma factor [Gemmatimonadaceae bacterium]
MSSDFEELIQRAGGADPGAADALFTQCYQELHRVAERALRRDGGALTLGATTLLHEAYLDIARRDGTSFVDRARFLAYASRAMRGLVIDYARHQRARKRGRQFEITLAADAAPCAEWAREAEEMARLGDALDELAALEPSLAELVDLHFFCGFTFAEIAAVRGVSERTVQRDWRKARLLLQRALTDHTGESEPSAPGGRPVLA